jgi:hypothetical protein
MSLDLPRVPEHLVHSHQKYLQSPPLIDHHAKLPELLVRHQELPVPALAAVPEISLANLRRNLPFVSVALAPVLVLPHADATEPRSTSQRLQPPLSE